jgi:membrane-bound lytic murein transglycosylase B
MRALRVLAVLLLCAVASLGAASDTPQPFDEWLAELIGEARARGFGDELLERTLVGLSPLPRVIASDRRQPESVIPFDEYLKRRITPERVARGRELLAQHRDVLDRVSETYGVPPKAIVSIWGLESRFGDFTGDVSVIQALATLAWERRRAQFFRGQLFDALTILDRGDIDAATMRGSWAGAMGQPQFMPSSYLAFAVDFDDDGRRDIWSSPADTFASIANYLSSHGWRKGEPWGHEVDAPPAAVKRATRAFGHRRAVCRAMKEMIGPARLPAWQKLGVRRADGESWPKIAGSAALVAAGTRRFLVYDNYDAILRYNCAHAYALTVAIFADRLD